MKGFIIFTAIAITVYVVIFASRRISKHDDLELEDKKIDLEKKKKKKS